MNNGMADVEDVGDMCKLGLQEAQQTLEFLYLTSHQYETPTLNFRCNTVQNKTGEHWGGRIHRLYSQHP